MNEITHLKPALLKYAKPLLDATNDWYGWRTINQNLLPEGISLSGTNQYSQNLSLKWQLHRKLQGAGQTEKFTLFDYYVRVWGGIRAIHPETIEKYSSEKAEQLIARGHNGIASWSKMLCIYDPASYAIFDARVSVSLNALQIIHDTQTKQLFPILASQNKTITAANQNLKKSTGHWEKASNDEFYNNYIASIEGVAATLKQAGTEVSMQTVEMLLFSKAEELAREAKLA